MNWNGTVLKNISTEIQKYRNKNTVKTLTLELLKGIEMSISWTEKYRPETLNDVAAQGRAMKDIKKWADGWERGRPENPALLFYGPPGTGKSATAAALANERGWDIIEMNASNKRTKGEIERIAGSAASMGSLTGGEEKRLIVLDEADNVHGTSDRGGYTAISKLLNETQNPIILIGNDRYEIPNGIRNKSKEVNFRRLRKSSIAKVLRQIAREEGIEVKDPGALKKLGERADGDLRSAINDFQAICEGKTEIRKEDITTQERDRKINIFKGLGKLKKTRDLEGARQALRDLDETPEDTIDWIEENLPKMMGNIPDLADAYERLARADIFLGRARKKQNYSFWKYASDLMGPGIALARKGKPGEGRFGYPSSRKAYGRSKKKRGIRDGVTKKISDEYHVSPHRAINDFIPYLATIFQNDREKGEKIARELELEDSEVEYLQDF